MPRLLTLSVSLCSLVGCASTSAYAPAIPSTTQAVPQLSGSYHTVQRGETLWRIARAYGVELDALAQANRIAQTRPLHVGQRLFVPLPNDSAQFLWPVRGTYRMAGGSALSISAPTGSVIRASRRGQVAVAAHQIPGLGKTIILDHGAGYVSIYSGLEKFLVNPGVSVPQGMPIGTIGPSHLYFEIRYQTRPRNPLELLPRE